MKETYQEKLANNLLYVQFSLSMWSAKIRDKKTAREAEDRAGAARKTKGSWKYLCKDEIAAIHSLGRKVRKLVDDESYSMGLLTGIHKDKGKVVTSETFDRIKPLLQQMIGQYVSLVQDFCDDKKLEPMIENDMKRHGADADRKDYPEGVNAMRSKFSIDLKTAKFSVGQTMLFDIMDESIIDIEKASEEKAKELVEKLTKENFERMKEPLNKLAVAMRDYGKSGSYFKQATLDDVERIVDVMEGFNFSNDTRVSEIISEVKNALVGLDGKALRDSAQDRAMVEGTADRIVNKIESYF